MKIFFIYPDINSAYHWNIHFGIAYLSGFLKQNGYKDIKFISINEEGDYQHIVKEVMSFKPDIIGFTAVETQFKNVLHLSKLLKNECGAVIVCGGAFPTLYPECAEAESLDGIFIGESEQSFLKFVKLVEQNKDYHNVENFCFYDKEKKSLIKNNLFPLEKNLDNFGFADKGLFDFQKVIDSYFGIAPFLFNRGCPYDCAFCSNHAIASIYGKAKNYIRRRSVESCIAEIKDVNKKYVFNAINFWDDLFVLDRKWLYKFLEQYKKEIKIPFICTVRTNLCDDELLKKLKDVGCYKIHMSIESGNDFIRNRVMRRNVSRESIIKSFYLTQKYGIEVIATTIIGLPFETEDMIKETISLLGILKIESPGVNIFYPYKGTRLRNLCEEYGFFDKKLIYDFKERRESCLDLPHINKLKISYYFENFERLVRKEEGQISYWEWNVVRLTKQVLKMILPEKTKRMIKKYRFKSFGKNNG